MSVKTALRRSMDRLTVPLALLALLALLPSASADWPMEGYDGGRTSATPGEFPERYEVAWVFNGTDKTKQNIVASSTLVYYWDNDRDTRQNYLRAVRIADGAEIWNTSTVPFRYVSQLTLAGEFLVVNIDTSLFVYNATTGQEKWNYTMDENIEHSAVVEGDRLYAVDWEKTIHVFNLTSGELLSQHDMNTDNIWAWAVVDSVVYYYGDFPGPPSEDDGVYAFDTTSNTSLWKYPIENNMKETIMVAEGKVFYGNGVNVYVLNATTGGLITSFPAAGFAINDLAWSESTLVVSVDKRVKVKPFEGSKGREWSRTLLSRPFSLAVGDGKIIVQESNSTITRLLVLDLFTGEELDVVTFDELSSWLTPIFSDGRIYFTTDTHLYALRKLRQPDLTVADLALTPADNLREGDTANLTFALRNLGDRGALNGTVTVSDNGAPLGSEPLANVTMGWQQNYTVPWDTTGRPGWHDLTVAVEAVEPEDYDLSDNRAMLRVYVRPLRVDGALLGAEYAPAEPKAGDAVRFNVAVANAGETVLEGLTLTLYDNGTHAASVPVPRLALGESRNLTLEWRADTPGDHALALVLEGVMPADTSPANNSLDLSLPVRPLRLDLALAGLSLEPARPRVGEGVKLSAAVTNRGEGRVTAAVRFYLGNTTGELLDEISITLEPGETAYPALPWHPPRAGKLALTVEVADDYGDYQPENNRLTQVVPVQGDAEALEGRPWVYVGAALTVTGAAAAGLWHWRWRG